ncbi:hypothetical protein EsH8_VII_000990 [Colletotrichum jinshuiense]
MAVDMETVQHLADNGHVISNKEVSDIVQAEKAQTGNVCPVASSLACMVSSFIAFVSIGLPVTFPLATAQSLHDKQQNFLNKEAEIAKKPESDITKEDAKEIQSAEARLLGHRPPTESVSAHIQSIADKNENARHPEGKKEDQSQDQAKEVGPAEKVESVSSKDTEASKETEKPAEKSQ